MIKALSQNIKEVVEILQSMSVVSDGKLKKLTGLAIHNTIELELFKNQIDLIIAFISQFRR